MVYVKPNYKKAAEKADKVLVDNCISHPPIPIDELAGNYGLRVLEMSFPTELAHVSGIIDMNNGRIIVNQEDGINRKVFTIAHELGHWLLHKEILEENPERSLLLREPIGQLNSDPIETEANFFAANLLVPMKLLRQYPCDDIGLLAKLFGVSKEVIGYRLANGKS